MNAYTSRSKRKTAHLWPGKEVQDYYRKNDVTFYYIAQVTKCGVNLGFEEERIPVDDSYTVWCPKCFPEKKAYKPRTKPGRVRVAYYLQRSDGKYYYACRRESYPESKKQELLKYVDEQNKYYTTSVYWLEEGSSLSGPPENDKRVRIEWAFDGERGHDRWLSSTARWVLEASCAKRNVEHGENSHWIIEE